MNENQPRSKATCPDSETIAALIDGRLGLGARAAVETHLANCDACRELLAETARFLADERPEVQASETRAARGRWSSLRWPLAAALAIALGGGLWSVSRRDRTEELPGVQELAGLAASSGVRARLGEDWSAPAWGIMRSAEHREVGARGLAFRFGVRSADLELALALAETERAERLATELAGLAAALPFGEPVAAAFHEVAARLAGGEPPRDLEGLARRAGQVAMAASDGSLFALGRWSESERLGRRGVAASGRARPVTPPPGAVPRELAAVVAAAVDERTEEALLNVIRAGANLD